MPMKPKFTGVFPVVRRRGPQAGRVRATICVVPMNRLTAAGDIPDTGIPPAIAVGMTMAEQYQWHQAYLRRHRVSRRNFLPGSAALTTVAATGLSPFRRRAYAGDPPLPVANRRVGEV